MHRLAVVSAPAAANRKLGKKLYLLIFELTGKPGDRSVLREEHFAYVSELERRGVLFAAGPFVDEAGTSQGGGMFIVRAQSMEEAEEIARQEPYIRDGYRHFRVQAWRVSEGTFSVRVNFSDGSYQFD
jgi:uncharacterized protein YciI